LLGLALNLTRIKALFLKRGNQWLVRWTHHGHGHADDCRQDNHGPPQISKPQWVIGWISTGVMLAVAATMLVGFAFT
jgi:hypothetical protein